MSRAGLETFTSTAAPQRVHRAMPHPYSLTRSSRASWRPLHSGQNTTIFHPRIFKVSPAAPVSHVSVRRGLRSLAAGAALPYGIGPTPGRGPPLRHLS